MTAEEAHARMKWLVAEIDRHDRLYYVEARPVIGDRDYDLLYEELLRLERDYPQFLDPNSPTQRVSGAPMAGFAQVRHDPPMQSLDKTHSKGELADFDAMVRKEAEGFTYLVEPKVDGVSMSLRYEGRRLVRAATRGNGIVGDDVTQNVRTIRSVPLSLPADAPETLEVRGEVYMTRDGFVKLNAREEEAGREPFANPRNACAGSLKQLDPKETANRPLDIVVYNAGGVGCDGFASHSEMIAAFRCWGFPTSPWSRSCRSMEEVFAAIDELEGLRHTFRFEIDGAVVKIDERRFYSVLGATAHGPRWARAYKYAPERAETVVESITVQVGRTGILTPVAELRPTELAGSVISRATLHNADQVARQDIRIGDHVWLVKAGDVIPAVESVIAEKRTGEEREFVMPTACPVCGGATEREEGEVAVRCVNPSCPAQLSRRIEHFASRNALDIRALGETVVDALVEKKMVADPLDLFSMRVADLYALEISGHRFGKNAMTVMEALEAAKSLPLHRWLFAIGIPNVGVTVARDIAAEHAKFSDLAGSPVLRNVVENDAKKGKERKILKIKVEAAKAVLAFFESDYGRRFAARMAELGIDPAREESAPVAATWPLAGLGCVLTGTLSRPRDEYAEMIRRAGGIVQSAVTSKTRYLIAGANVGATKTEKARRLGTEVIDETRLLELLKSGAKSLVLAAVCAAALLGSSGCSTGPYVYPDSRTYAELTGRHPDTSGVKEEFVTLSNSHGTARISLVGANVTSYVPAGGEEVLFSVRKPDFLSDSFQHCGIPVVWPWFNMNGEAGSAAHSFVRQMKWSVVAKEESANMSRIVLEVVSSDETRRLWPYEFRLRYTVVLDDQLRVSLVTENTDSVPFEITEGFHAYFRVSDVDSVVLRGLDGCRNDRIVSWLYDPVFEGDLRFHAGEGRVFTPGKGEYVLFDEGAGRAICMAASGHRKLILWSIPESSCEGAFSGDDWKHFVCLEPSTISREAALLVQPGKRHELRMSVKAVPLKRGHLPVSDN